MLMGNYAASGPCAVYCNDVSCNVKSKFDINLLIHEFFQFHRVKL